MKKFLFIILSVCSIQWMICSCEKSNSDHSQNMDDSTNELTDLEIAEQNLYDYVRYEIYEGEEWPSEGNYVEEIVAGKYDNLEHLCAELDLLLLDQVFLFTDREYDNDLFCIRVLEQDYDMAEVSIDFKNRSDLERAFIMYSF